MSMSSSIALDLGVQQHRGCTSRVLHKKQRKTNPEQTKKTNQKTENKKTKKNKETNKLGKIQVLIYFCFFFSGDSSNLFVFFVVNLFLIMWLMFFCWLSFFLLQSTFSVPVGLKMLNNKFIDSSYSPYAPWKTCQSCMFRECQSCFPRFYTKYHYTATLILMILVCIFCC